MKEYNTIEEKKNFFKNGDSKVVTNIEGIFKILDDCSATTDFIFRGMPEAKYMLYNSAQRNFIQSELYLQTSADFEELYDTWIEQLIDGCKKWNFGTVINLLKSFDIKEENSLAFLSYMQHYGAPTPLLDFTRDPYTALYFAIETISPTSSNIEIDNYFSIYYVYTNNTEFEAWNSVFEKNIPDLKHGLILYNDVNKNRLQLLHPVNESYKLYNNTNIINQQGLFFYNNDPFKPIEEMYLEVIKETKEHLGQIKFDELLCLDEFVCCINIHKSLIPSIKEKLESKGITKGFIYPDPQKIKDFVLLNSSADSIQTSKTL